LASNIVIKDVEEVAYRNLRREAIKAGLKVGEAASGFQALGPAAFPWACKGPRKDEKSGRKDGRNAPQDRTG